MVSKFASSLGAGKHIDRLILYCLLIEIYYVISHNSSVVNFNTVDILQSSSVYIVFLIVTFYIAGLIFLVPYVVIYFALMFIMRYLYFFPFLWSKFWRIHNKWQNRHKLDVYDTIGYATHTVDIELHDIAQRQIDKYKLKFVSDATYLSSFISFIILISITNFNRQNFLHIFSSIAGGNNKYIIYYGIVSVIIWQFALRLALSATGFISSMKLQDSWKIPSEKRIKIRTYSKKQKRNFHALLANIRSKSNSRKRSKI